MQANRVSVIIPVYNGSQYLRQAIDSVLTQTHPDVEIIAIDDGSTDDSLDLLSACGSRVVVLQQANSGVAAARNAGMQRATGEYLAFLDQDDAWLPEKLSRQVAAMQADDGVGLVHTAIRCFDGASGQDVAHYDPQARPAEMSGHCYDRLLLSNPICNSSVMVRHTVVQQVGLCDLQIGGNTVADYDLWIRIAEVSRLAYLSEPLVRYRIHPGQGQQDRRAMLTAELDLLLRMQPKQQWCESAECRRRLSRLYDGLAIASLDAGEAAAARNYFREALNVNRDGRQVLRFAVSFLPLWVVNPIRRVKQEKIGSN